MPLNRSNITIASAVMLPAYLILDTAFAVLFITDPQLRLQAAPSLDYARSWMPVPVWGWLWLVLALMMLTALTLGHRGVFIAALAINAAAWFAWGVLTGAAIFSQPNVTYLAGVLPWFVATASFASMVSLLSWER